MRDTQHKKLVSDIDFRRTTEVESKAALRRILAEAMRNTAAMQADNRRTRDDD